MDCLKQPIDYAIFFPSTMGGKKENCLIPSSRQSVLMEESLPRHYCVLQIGNLPCWQNTMITAGYYSHQQ